MCIECVAAEVKYRAFAVSTEGDINGMVTILANAYGEDRKSLVELTTIGASLCADLLMSTAPPGGKVLMARASTLPTSIAELTPHVDDMVRVLQTALDVYLPSLWSEGSLKQVTDRVTAYTQNLNLHECRLFCAGIALHYLCVVMKPVLQQYRAADVRNN